MLIVKGTWWTLFSVLYEELIFRGVVLYILIKRIGEVKAILISCIAFGIYHWFSYGLFWNIR
jgi:membrane protease YdiL (CAAX protease family)